MSDISSDPGGRGIKVTVKYGKGHEEPWIVFTGLPHEVREDLVAVFGGEDDSELPLSQLVLNLASEACAMQVCAAKLGAKAVPSKPVSNVDQPDEAQADPWAQAEKAAESNAEPSAKPNAGLHQAIEAAASVDELKRLWAENQQAFTDDAELLGAWKQKGKALK